MHRQNIIVIYDPETDTFETWGSLTEACDLHGWSYNYLKRLNFPFIYKGLTFVKTEYRTRKIQS